MLKHNGALFTEDHFRSITGILFGEQDDENNVRRIGYKGIGFKSVFRHSTNVYVRSGNFSFAFTKETGDDKPWEVMPIFQNEIDKIKEINQFDFFNSPVAFAFEFPNDESKGNVIKYLSELSANPYLLIFLKKLIKLKITIPKEEKVYEKEIVEENGREIIKLKQSDGTIYDWLRFSGEYQIEAEEIIKELTDETNKFNSPKHLLGESYGTFRNAGLVKYLQDKGIVMNGVIMVSAVFELQHLLFDPGDDLAFLIHFPTYAATAWYHNKVKHRGISLESFLDEVRDFT